MLRSMYILVVSLSLLACATSEPVPEDRFYQLKPVVPDKVFSSPVLAGGLEVDYTGADPLRSGRAVVYSEKARPLQLNRYHYAFWVDQPPRLVHGQLVQYLRASGISDRIDDGGRRETAQFRLKTHVLRFEQVRGGPEPEVVVELEASLEKLPEGTVLWTSVYRQRQTTGGDHMHATAESMQSALGQVFGELMQDLAAAGE
jgi:ABC-type uncharacterized transport system auxiliary subunit